MGIARRSVIQGTDLARLPAGMLLSELAASADARQGRVEKLLGELLAEQQATNRWLAYVSSQLPPPSNHP
jgi:hypothetical protein